MEVFFSRPGKKEEIKDRIITDIKYTKKRLLISVFSLSDPEIAEAIDESKAFDKRIVYNYKVNLEKTIDGKEVPLIKDKQFINENCAPLGNSFSQMHHKFIIVDNALWTGTYNLSFNANSNNWENMMRITDKDVIGKFIEEFDKMYVFSKAIKNKLNLNKCIDCNNEVEDPFEHFRIEYLTVHNNMVTIKNGYSSFFDEEKVLVDPEDCNYDSFDISCEIKSWYRAVCLKDKKGSKWSECYKCKEKGILERMPLVARRIVNNVKKEGESDWKKLNYTRQFENYPDRTTCLACLHTIIIEETKISSPDSRSEIPFSHFHYCEDPI